MLRMEDPVNGTMMDQGIGSNVDPASQVTSGKDNNEYLYILIVMSFYGIFLMGIMLVYMRSKRKEKDSKLLLLYQDEEKQWMETRKRASSFTFSRLPQQSTMFNILQDSFVPGRFCNDFNVVDSSLSSESSSSDVHFTIQEEVAEGLVPDKVDDKNLNTATQIS